MVPLCGGQVKEQGKAKDRTYSRKKRKKAEKKVRVSASGVPLFVFFRFFRLLSGYSVPSLCPLCSLCFLWQEKRFWATEDTEDTEIGQDERGPGMNSREKRKEKQEEGSSVAVRGSPFSCSFVSFGYSAVILFLLCVLCALCGKKKRGLGPQRTPRSERSKRGKERIAAKNEKRRKSAEFLTTASF